MPEVFTRRAPRAVIVACLSSAAVAALGATPAWADPAATVQTAPPTATTASPIPDPQGPQPAGQPDRVTGRRTYDVAWFAQFSPATALQIVQRVPGFSIERVDESVRGFAQAAGNVVINGQRPSAKSDTIETILARIPASRVLRVEIAPGDQFGSEFTGKAQVVNLVMAGGGGLATTLEGSVRRDFTGRILPGGSVSTLVKRGNSTFNLSLAVDNETTTEEGYDRVVALPSRTEREVRRKVNRIADPNAALSGSWSYDGGTNRTAHVNARGAVDRFRLTQANTVRAVGAPVRDDALSQVYDLDEYELGGDVTRPLAGGGIKLVGLATRRHRDRRDLSLIDLSAPTGFSQRLDDRLDETLGRVAWNRLDWGGWNVEFGVEGVINRLQSRVDLFTIDAAGGRTRIDLPVDDATVREFRTETFLNAGRALTPNLRLDLGLNGETSSLTVRGDAEADRRLSFLKPKVVLDWRFGGKWHAQASLQRSVAQLQFEDFISSAELTNERVNGGNAQLLPQRAWDFRATLERPILGDGLARIEAGYSRVSMVQDRVPTPEGFDAPGNLGDGSIYILRGRVEAPLKTLGIKGGRLTLYGSLVPTSVRDPYTGRDRPFSNNSLFYGTVDFRQDLGSFAWGFSVERPTPSIAYRLDETDRQIPPLYSEIFAEWRPDPRSVVNFKLENVLASPGMRDRTFYAPDRRTALPFAEEYRRRNRHVIPALTFKRTFG